MDEEQRSTTGDTDGRDEEDAVLVNRIAYGRQTSVAAVLDEDELRPGSRKAIANQANIMEIGKILREIGDSLQGDYDNRYQIIFQAAKEQPQKSFVAQTLSNILSTVDDVFEYMEYIGQSITFDMKSHEGKLRGIYKFANLAFQLEMFAFMKIIVSCIDDAEDPYPTERKHIIESLKSVEDNETEIIELVKEVSEILSSILKERVLDYVKARQFDDAARRASLAIKSCERTLESIEPVLEALLRKTNTIKWFSRGIRLFCMGITWSYLYEKYKGSDIPMPVALGGGVLSGFMWLSLFPNRSYELFDSLRELKCSSERLYIKLEKLNDRMNSDVDAKNKLFQVQKD